ncbi:NAD-dependent deacylase [Pleomorphomonas sp. JP5]|uniref:NAD-dependent deacylase n=1 Tax=Pleomorphomonas sp. JP5 TaxID=2942998 RepID=UPI002042DB90|nr:NAD-dependent deacylase [Pleomorphomonas sp. JP5]MCM5559087.1 NAD-dependent deacylase [Pleomorphomonas sp. JP5]
MRDIEISPATSIVVLTGAGISQESGLDTFRDAGGIWARYDIDDVATPEGFRRNPPLVHDFYNEQRREAAIALPNPAHVALAELEKAWPGRFLLVTQNIDGLHEKAGSKALFHMHGTLDGFLCEACEKRGPWGSDMSSASICPLCGTKGTLRPDIVWFGEMPYHMPEIYRALGEADLFLSIGTSGTVYPAADFVREARQAGALTVELNLEASRRGYGLFDIEIEGKASECVPTFVRDLLGRQGG